MIDKQISKSNSNSFGYLGYTLDSWVDDPHYIDLIEYYCRIISSIQQRMCLEYLERIKQEK